MEWSSGDYDGSGLAMGSRANISEHEQGACMAASMISGSFFLLFNRVCPLQMSSVEGRVERRCKVLNLVLGISVQRLPPAFLRTAFKDWMEKIVLCISKEGLKTAD